MAAKPRHSSNFGFGLVIAFLILEYGRPHDTVSFLGHLQPTGILLSLMFIAWWKSGKLQTVASPQLYVMLAMLVLLALSVPLAANSFRAFQVTKGYLLMLPLCASIILFVDDLERLKRLLSWWVFLGGYISIRSISGVGVAGSSFLADENDVALINNVMLPFAVCLFIFERKKLLKFAYLGVALLCVVSIVTTASRGGFVGLLAVLLIIWLVSPRKILSLLLVCLLGAVIYFSADHGYWADMSTINQTDEGTAKGRLDSWHAGWEMFKDNPLGVGAGNFPVHFPDYQPPTMGRSMWGRAAHSLWFTLLPELGIPGVILYLLLLKANFKDLFYLKRLTKLGGGDVDDEDRRFAHYLSVAFIASLCGFFATATFLSVLFYPHYWYLSAMIVAAKRAFDSKYRSTPALQSRASGARILLRR